MATPLARISLRTLKGVGDKMAEKLGHLGLFSLEDLLFHLPIRYQDRSRIHPIASLIEGQTAQIYGKILGCEIVFGKRRSLVCKVSDGTGLVEIRLFYFSMAQKKQLVPGQYLQCFGCVSHAGRSLSMVHPEITYLHESAQPKLQQGLQAIYPTTEGLQQRSVKNLIDQALIHLQENSVVELLPKPWLNKLHFPSLCQALRLLHKPPSEISLQTVQQGEHPLIKRLAFEELVARQIALQASKSQQKLFPAYRVKPHPEIEARLRGSLKFSLTQAQNRVIAQVQQDLDQEHPMMRLVQGDVGSGKTLVAALSMLGVVHSGLQAVMMVPTEILAEQQAKAFQQWFEPLGIAVTLLTSKMPTASKRATLQAIACGQSKIAIGTHALFQSQVQFSNLALVVIDEQHRFGVEQRKSLLEKARDANPNGQQPHQLVMTATPIPRTLAQTAYADLDLSVIDELPPGRKPITTAALAEDKRPQLIERVRQAALKDKRQIYWVCTLITDSEELQCQAAEATYQQLSESLPELRVGLIHGAMKADEKQAVMRCFKQGEIDLLVATTVIEVGVDVANASLMIIENSERLGLSQLHQLRGRVGRGSQESHCVLMYHPPLSQNARQRLGVMRETNDGFIIAEKDLELRGPGEVLGTRQTGAVDYRFADLIRDSALLIDVYQCAAEIIEHEPKRAAALCQRWIKQKHELIRV